MKVLTILGTRPEIIRLSIIIKKLDELLTHVLLYTNQNFTDSLSTIFFKELRVRQPDYVLAGGHHSFGAFLSAAISDFEQILLKEKPDKVLILGDTNSGLLSLVANRYRIPIIHMESGNRCLDNRVPEETNRRLIDHLSTINLPYTENSKQNLLSEGFNKNTVFKTGNPIYEVLDFYRMDILASDVLNRLSLKEKEFVLVTAHRAENVDDVGSLLIIMEALNYISREHKVVFSVHPRTRSKLNGFNISNNIILSEPFGFFDFVKLEQSARLVISDSGTVQEECCIYGTPSITIRETTERQETVECGSNILTGIDYVNIKNAFEYIITGNVSCWQPPQDYLVHNVSDIVINILLGKN